MLATGQLLQVLSTASSLSLYKITDVRLKPFKLLLWTFQPETVGARTVPELHSTKTPTASAYSLLPWTFEPETVGARTPPELHGSKILDALMASVKVFLLPLASLNRR
jgi:hypothetical protein